MEIKQRRPVDVQALIDTTEDYAIYLLAPDGCVATWNPGAQRIHGYESHEIIGRDSSLLFPLEDARNGKPSQIRERATAEGRCEDHGWRVRSDGATFWAHEVVTALKDSAGDVAGFGIVTRDITEQHRTEDDLRRMNARLQEWVSELETRTAEITLLGRMTDMLQSCLTAREAYAVVATFSRQLFPGASGALYLREPGTPVLEAVIAWDNPASERTFEVELCWALRRGRSHYVCAAEIGMFCRHVISPGTSASLCVPLMAKGEALGVYHLQCPQTTGVARGSVETAAGNVAMALANLQLREKLSAQSTRDPLTGLFNRRYMEESLEREIRRADRNHRALGAIMLDVDHFKRFNDTHGHEAGDCLLREIASILQGNSRKEDFACRYGGEEFTLILPEASLESTAHRAEHLRNEVQRLALKYHGKTLAGVTISAGVAAYPQHGANPEALLRAADAALYEAKESGRDRVMSACAGESKGEPRLDGASSV